MTVLEIGTGTGYNAALVCERLGSQHVTQITTPDGAWAEVSKTSPALVKHGGPADIWRHVENVHTWWTAHGSPGVEAFGLTVGRDEHRLWHETPERENWPPPL